MPVPTPRLIWSSIALGAGGVVLLSIGLTEWFNLHPCHLCIFQRLLFMILAVLALTAALFATGRGGRILGFAVALTAAAGLATALYQSFLERQPPSMDFSCVGAEPTLIERLVERLGEWQPLLFLATGFCDEMGPQFLGLSLANAALVGFLMALIAAVAALMRHGQAPNVQPRRDAI
ncbi:disulfide bond formation protein B [Thioalkalicoccus limnaeus]|uniref:Disulfide bond formation protein B n=1 Tax=Thioalkalicoccus limnaeus TaxID=120681 RepID=A0ABV4BEW6_9GAMM